MDFSHLHVHTQYSLLDGAASVKGLIKSAVKNNIKAVAITDHGNMFGVPEFVNTAKQNGILPIIGCEFYLAKDSRFSRSKSEEQDEKNIFHQLLLAKNKQGYKNLSKLCSLGYIEGYYYKPRIDKELIRQYREGLIATTCCLASEVNQRILRKGEEEAEKLFLEWLDIFGEDYYIELQRHGIPEQDKCNEVLLKWSKKHNVKVVATNDVHYVEQKDSEAQDILLCLQTGKDLDDPNRMKFENNQFYLKSKEEMMELFADIPEAIDNTNEIVSKIETPDLTRDILLPIFELPPGFNNENEYLAYLTYHGAERRYPELTPELKDRIEYELSVVSSMKFAGYFLIVQDFVAAARKLGVAVGPGRGSAAGSVIAYCTGITNVDPIAYNLLFERFLNPERVSMPDIDIDFDDRGREKVINYVVDKYGKNKVAQIITFGSMMAKSAIRDVARVMKLPLPEANALAKMVPEKAGTSLKEAFDEIKELADARKNGNILTKKTLGFAETLEGCKRHTGLHAAGIIISPDDLSEHVPLCTSKDSNLYVTQYEGNYVESVGMLKMDFLGLKTLTIIKDALSIIEKTHGVKIDLDKIPLDDEKTFELYQQGDTIGTFQFESDGMRGYLKDLKPSNIEDLIAMNALYRPGPMDFIPDFISCKHGRKKVEFPHEMLREILEPTYGIMVYQEQIMKAVQIMGGFTPGAADNLRKAISKKKASVIEKDKVSFIRGAEAKGVDSKNAQEVFEVIMRFASYGFNRSHSAAYSIVAFQTAYLKAHYTVEYMAAVLTNNMNDLKKMSFFMDACKRSGITVHGPDINESELYFTPNKRKEIRFGLGAVKGVGENAALAIISEREENGPFEDYFEFIKRVNLRSVNKKCLESLASAGAFDSFQEIHRAQYYYVAPGETLSGIEKSVKFGNSFREDSNNSQPSLFGSEVVATIDAPCIPDCEPWSELEILKREKEVIGIYISGHPLDQYKLEMETFCNTNAEELNKDLSKFKNREVCLGGIISEAAHRTTKTGKAFGTFTLEDYSDNIQIPLFSDDYLKFQHFLKKDLFVFVKAKVHQRMGAAENFEVKISQVILLSELMEKLPRELSITIDVNMMDEKVLQSITGFASKTPGNVLLKLSLVDKKEKVSLDLQSRKYKVQLNGNWIRQLNTMGMETKIS